MKGQRKFWMCMAYLATCCFLNWTLIQGIGVGADLTALGIALMTMDGAMAAGVGVVVVGNVKVAQANGSKT